MNRLLITWPLWLAACSSQPLTPPDAHVIRRDAWADDVASDAWAPTCPPQAPFGTRIGERIRDHTVYDCDGNPVRLHELCGAHELVWIWDMAEWCEACRVFAGERYDPIFDRLRARHGDRLRSVGVITSDALLNRPNEEVCREMRTYYGIDAPIYFDPTGTLPRTIGGFSNDQHVILDGDLRILWSMQFAGEVVEAEIERQFARIAAEPK